jgi:hypothetical protein
MGGFLPRQNQWLADKIRPAGGRWSVVEWLGSKPVGWQTGLVAAERGGGSSEGLSTAGEGRRQAGVGVTGGVRAVREEVLSATMLGVGSRWSERGRSGLSAVAQRR